MRERGRNVLNNPRGCLFLFLYSPPTPTTTPRGHCCYAILVERIVEEQRYAEGERRVVVVVLSCLPDAPAIILSPIAEEDRRAISPRFLQKGCQV